MKEIKLGCPMEYEIDNVIYNGLFLRENEANIVFKELEKFNKQKEVLDKILKLKRYTSLMEYDEEFVKVKDILKLLEEIE